MISTLVTVLFFSPVIFAAAFIAALLLRGRKKAAVIVSSAAAGLLLLLSVEPVHDLILFPLENGYPPLGSGGIDAVIVLGGGTIGSRPDLQGGTGLTQEALARLVYGASLARAQGVPLYVAGGKTSPRAGDAEAAASARVLAALGLTPRTLVLEDKSRTTWENARFLAPMLKDAGVTAAALVTSAYHMPRGMMSFRKAGVGVTPAPTDYKTQRTPYSFSSFFPSFQTLKETFQALREYLGLLQYSMMR